MVILGVGAHPDDLDFCAGGTFAKWAQEGHACYYLVCTDGRKGSDDPKMTEEELVKLRQNEQREAAKILGIKEVFFLSRHDIELVADLELKKEIVKYIRKLKPDIVVTWDPNFIYSKSEINHTDHRACGLATLDAVYPLARDRLTFPEDGEPYKVGLVYLMTFAEDADEIVDVSQVMKLKLQALRAHKSQFKEEDLKKVKKTESFIKIEIEV